jgi:uncharacterized protein (DUF924 family)
LAAPQRAWAAELLYVWFHKIRPREWFAPTPALDAMLERRFGREWEMLRRRPADEFLGDPLTALAAVLLFDQVPRNIHRGTPLAYASDALGRRIALEVMARGWDRGFNLAERQFLGLPLMHSEAIADQQRSLAYFAPLGPGYGRPFARAHYRMIARFGRFPHRNGVLGRHSTAAERRAVAEGNNW